jgi:Ca2+:H+ antiporter
MHKEQSTTEEPPPPKKVTPGIKPAGESGRSGFHPLHFLKIIWTSSSRASKLCNILWPVVPAAIAVKC